MRQNLALIIVCLLILYSNQTYAFGSVYVNHQSTNPSLFKRIDESNQKQLKVQSRKQATSMVKKQYNARVLSVVSAKSNGNSGYKAKLLDKNGTVFYVFINAETGRMSRS